MNRVNIDLIKSPGLIIMHLPVLLVFWAGFSWVALAACVVLYLIRGVAVTGGYHRYFSHRTFKTSRFFQFVIAWVGASAVQQGPLWWAAHHRLHHKYSDTEEDVHSPVTQPVWYAHMGWIASPRNRETHYRMVPDLAKYPELRFINRFHLLPPVLLAVALWLVGAWLARAYAGLGTSGLQMLTWGFFVNTMLLYHSTFAINSLTHMFGRRRFPTKDESRNSFLIALFTLGEGWHNNHHYFPASERQGFFWWEIDFTHYVVVALERLGLVWDVQTPPERIYQQAALLKHAAQARPSQDMS